MVRTSFFHRNVIYNGDNDLHMVDKESLGTEPPLLNSLNVKVVIKSLTYTFKA
jgi:hypothetical protein